MFNDIERQELEAEQAAAEDYRREAYGSEADMLAAQMGDEIAADNGYPSYAAYLAALKAAQPAPAPSVDDSDVPF